MKTLFRPLSPLCQHPPFFRASCPSPSSPFLSSSPFPSSPLLISCYSALSLFCYSALQSFYPSTLLSSPPFLNFIFPHFTFHDSPSLTSHPLSSRHSRTLLLFQSSPPLTPLLPLSPCEQTILTARLLSPVITSPYSLTSHLSLRTNHSHRARLLSPVIASPYSLTSLFPSEYRFSSPRAPSFTSHHLSLLPHFSIPLRVQVFFSTCAFFHRSSLLISPSLPISPENKPFSTRAPSSTCPRSPFHPHLIFHPADKISSPLVPFSSGSSFSTVFWFCWAFTRGVWSKD